MTMPELRAELSKVCVKKDDFEVLSSALSEIEYNYKDASASVNGKEMKEALIAASPKDHLSSIKTQEGQLQ